MIITKSKAILCLLLLLLVLLTGCGKPASETTAASITYTSEPVITGNDTAAIINITADSATLFLLAKDGAGYSIGKSTDGSTFEWLQLELPEGYFPVALAVDHDGSLYVAYFSSTEVEIGVYETSVLISTVNDGVMVKEIARFDDYRCPTDMKFDSLGQLYLAIGNSPADATTSTRIDHVLHIGDSIEELSGSGMNQILEEVFALQDDTINWGSMGWNDAPQELLTFRDRLFALSENRLYELVEGAGTRQKITLGIVSGLTDSSVEGFNASNSSYMVEVVYYESVEALGLAIAAGNAPDVINLRQIPVSSYINKGILEDLTPWFKASNLNEEDYFSSVLRLTRQEGKCYSVVTSFSLGGIAANSNLTKGAASWTFEEMRELLGNNIKFSRPLQDLFCFEDASYFTTDRIKAVLEFAGSLKERKSSDSISAFACQISSVDDVASNRMVYQQDWPEGVDYLGYPSDNGTGLVLRPDLGTELAMLATSNNKDGAWEYIEYTLSEGNQDMSFFLPVRIASYEKICNELLDDENTGITEDDIRTCKELIESADVILREDLSILSMIEEEAAAYFDGNKTAEAVAEIIQNRVQTYLNERG